MIVLRVATPRPHSGVRMTTRPFPTVQSILDACTQHEHAFVGMAVQRAAAALIEQGKFKADDEPTTDILIQIYTWIGKSAMADSDLLMLSMVHQTGQPLDDAMNYVQGLARAA